MGESPNDSQFNALLALYFVCFFSWYWYDREWARLFFVVPQNQPPDSAILSFTNSLKDSAAMKTSHFSNMWMIISGLDYLHFAIAKKQSWCWCKLYPQEMLDILQPFCAPCYCSYWLIGWQCNYCPRYDITICPGRTRNKGWLVARIKIRYYVHNNKYSESFNSIKWFLYLGCSIAVWILFH